MGFATVYDVVNAYVKRVTHVISENRVSFIIDANIEWKPYATEYVADNMFCFIVRLKHAYYAPRPKNG